MRSHWRRLGGWGGEGSQDGALRRDSSTGGLPEQLVDMTTSAAGGRWRPMASGMLR
jgi:hypothetical protein